MLYTAIGLLICLTPFLLVSLYKNKIRGFFTVLTSLAALHLLVALTTQFLQVFIYPVVISIHAAVALYACFVFLKSRFSKQKESSEENIQKTAVKNASVNASKGVTVTSTGKFKKLFRNWFVLIMIFLGLFLLYTIRFNYTGVVDTAIGLRDVKNSSYTYPQYSDEWIGSSLVSYSIRSGSLPLVNPLSNNEPFINFLLASHSLFGEIVLVLGLNPLTQYVYLAIANGLFIAVGVFMVLRLLLVRQAFAIISALSVFLLTNSGNLPSIWYILPYTVALTFFLFAIVGFLSKSRFVYLMNLIISLVLYPPIVLFVAPFLLSVSYGKKPDFEKIKFLALRVSIMLIIAFGLLALAGSQSFSLGEMYDRALSFVIRQSLDTGKVSYQFWNIIPIFLVPFICIGIYEAFVSRKRFILFPTLIGVLFWIVYGFTKTIFLMEPSRVIVISSILLLIIAGIGLEKTYINLNAFLDNRVDGMFTIGAKLCVCIFFFLWILFLPKLGLWHKLPMAVTLEGNERMLLPAPPVTRYLTQDDLNLFAPYKEKRFVAVPWKGLSIGAATQNFPLESKPSTLTNKFLRYQNFMRGDCVYKVIVARKQLIDLVYSSPFDCPNHFFKKGQSSEGFVLYEFIDTTKK